MKAIIFEDKIVTVWPSGFGRATISGSRFGHLGPFPEGVSVIDVQDIETKKPEGNYIPSWSDPVYADGSVRREQIWTEGLDPTPEELHNSRLSEGIEWEGKQYPCLKKDRDGLNGVIAGFNTADKLFQKWIVDNGPPTTPEETQRMVLTGAIPPEHRFTEFQWSNGDFLTLDEASAVAIAGKMSILVSKSFIQLKSDSGMSE